MKIFLEGMNKKGDDQFSVANLVYVVLLVVFALILFAFVESKQNGASLWEDIYVKEIVKVLDSAEVGDKIRLDVHKGVSVAVRNEIQSYSDIFRIDDSKNEVCVKLSSTNRRTCYSYFNDVDVVNLDLVLGDPTNYLVFEVIEDRGEGENE